MISPFEGVRVSLSISLFIREDHTIVREPDASVLKEKQAGTGHGQKDGQYKKDQVSPAGCCFRD